MPTSPPRQLHGRHPLFPSTLRFPLSSPLCPALSLFRKGLSEPLLAEQSVAKRGLAKLSLAKRSLAKLGIATLSLATLGPAAPALAQPFSQQPSQPVSQPQSQPLPRRSNSWLPRPRPGCWSLRLRRSIAPTPTPSGWRSSTSRVRPTKSACGSSISSSNGCCSRNWCPMARVLARNLPGLFQYAGQPSVEPGALPHQAELYRQQRLLPALGRLGTRHQRPGL